MIFFLEINVFFGFMGDLPQSTIHRSKASYKMVEFNDVLPL